MLVLEKIMPKVGDVLADRYRIEAVLGEGGFGVVYRAVQTNLDRPVALKMLLPHALTDEVAVQRFHREVDMARRLRHPNTVQIYDRGVTPHGLQFYVMEFVEGQALNDVQARETVLAPARVKHIAEQVLGSLGEAHQNGIVHRDLKPENIMLTEVFGQQDFVKVLDFGIGKQMGEGDGQDLTTKGIIGTVYYMSPEQSKGARDLDGRSDLYALGLIIHELLVGAKTYQAPTPLEVVMLHAGPAPVPLRPEVLATSLGPVIERAVQKDRAHRFPHATEMLAALKAISPDSLPAKIELLAGAGPAALAPLSPHTPSASSGSQPYPSQPYSSQPYPSQPYPSQPYPSQPNPPLPSQGYAGAPAASGQLSGPQYPDGAAMPGRSRSSGVSILLVVVLVLALGGVGAFFVLRGGGGDGAGGGSGGEAPGPSGSTSGGPVARGGESGPTGEADSEIGETVEAALRLGNELGGREAGGESEIGETVEAALRLGNELGAGSDGAAGETDQPGTDPDVARAEVETISVRAPVGTVVREGQTRGVRDASELRPYCVGYVPDVPSYRLALRESMQLGFLARSERDLVLYVTGPGGTFCNDDWEGTNPGLYQYLAAGVWDVYVGEYDAHEPSEPAVSYALTISATSPPRPEVAEPETAEPPEPIVAHIAGEPDRADVYLEDEQVCESLPCDLTLPEGEGPVEVVVRRRRYHSERLTLVREPDRTYQVDLRRREDEDDDDPFGSFR